MLRFKNFSLVVAGALTAGFITSCDPQKGEFVSAEVIQAVSDSLDCLFPAEKPGGAILIMQHDSVLLAKGCGLADMETNTPVTPQTNFCLASVSKQFTAIAVLQLCEQGKMSLDDEVRTFFPQFTDSIWNGITVRHLLSHSSGLPDARSGYTRPQRIYGDDNRSVAFFDTLSYVNFQPGTAYEYINPTFVLAGKIVEIVSGEPFADYMRNHIFEPAGMTSSRYFEFTANEVSPDNITAEEEPIENMAHGYEPTDSGWVECDFGETTFFATRPDGGLYSSVLEMGKWEKALLNGVLLSDSLVQEAWTIQNKVSESRFSDYNTRPNTGYGYGWFIESAVENHCTVIYHTGENGGFHNIIAHYPEKDVTVVLLSTRADWSQYDFLKTIAGMMGL